MWVVHLCSDLTILRSVELILAMELILVMALYPVELFGAIHIPGERAVRGVTLSHRTAERW
jgi:hypothetical protein